jgi:intracellular sulfur oxidation DsrE/DsrF family protein
MRRVVLLLALLAAVVVLVPSAHAAATAKKYRVLLQWAEADSMGQLVMTLHANNMLDDLGQDNVQLEILAYGPATFASTTTRPQAKFAEAIKKLTDRGVTFHVCSHAMAILGVKPEELQPTITPVQGAMSYMVKRHAEGWQILRP